MNTYTYCLCPRGNGIDTQDLGGIILWVHSNCKRHITHKFEYDLPIIFVEDWSSTDQYIQDKYNKINFDDFNSSIVRLLERKNILMTMIQFGIPRTGSTLVYRVLQEIFGNVEKCHMSQVKQYLNKDIDIVVSVRHPIDSFLSYIRVVDFQTQTRNQT